MLLSKVSKALYESFIENDMLGATVDQNGRIPKRGFMVSVDPQFEKQVHEIDYSTIYNYVKSIESYIKNKPEKCIGIWHNDNDGKFFMDVSTNVKSLNLAIALGKTYNQKAIFHLDTMTEIEVK